MKVLLCYKVSYNNLSTIDSCICDFEDKITENTILEYNKGLSLLFSKYFHEEVKVKILSISKLEK